MMPAGWVTHALDADPVVTVHAPPKRARDVEEAVSAAWSEAVRGIPAFTTGASSVRRGWMSARSADTGRNTARCSPRCVTRSCSRA